MGTLDQFAKDTFETETPVVTREALIPFLVARSALDVFARWVVRKMPPRWCYVW